jgi:hypothetical protein
VGAEVHAEGPEREQQPAAGENEPTVRCASTTANGAARKLPALKAMVVSPARSGA